MNSHFRLPPRPPKMMRQGPLMRRAPVPRAGPTHSSVAQVCPISKPQVPPQQPGIKLPVPTLAYDFPSALAAINAIVTIYSSQQTTLVRWVEKERVTQNVRIFGPDGSSYVDVVRIVKLIMEDVVTGELWWWELGGSVKQQLGIF